MKKIPAEDREYIVQRYLKGETTTEISKKYNCHRGTISNVLKLQGLDLNRMRVTENNIEEICQAYIDGTDSYELARIHNCTPTAITNALHKNGVKVRTNSESHTKYKFNHNAFDILNEESLYWAGFNFADGHLTKIKSSVWKLALRLQESDKGHLYKFKDFLKADSPVKTYDKKKTTKDGTRNLTESELQVYSNQIGNTLTSYGLVKHLKMDPIDKLANSKAFWRGVVDGDGHVKVGTRPGGKNKYFALEVLGNLVLMQKFQKFVKSIFPDVTANISKCVSPKIVRVRVSGKSACKLTKHLYENASIFLDRKKAVADEMGRLLECYY